MTALLPETTTLPADPLLVVKVTTDDIMNGSPNCAKFCAIAQAMRRLGFRHVSVDGENMIWADRDDQPHWASLPREAREFIQLYDDWDSKTACPWGETDDDCDCTLWPPAPITFSVEVHDGLPTWAPPWPLSEVCHAQ